MTYPSGKNITYSYDERGNRLGYIVTGGCLGDIDGDGDVDGSDLAAYIDDNQGISLSDFAVNFGRTDCP